MGTRKPENVNDRDSTESALRERVKELACLYKLTQILGDRESTINDQLSEIVLLLPPAWQYPEYATARITLDEATYEAGKFSQTRHVQCASIVINGTNRGKIEVGYTSTKLPDLVQGPFLQEELNLIENIAKQISSHIEHSEIEIHKKDLEDQLLHADRLATIGQLAAGVAHEMNEPLGNILGFAQLSLKTPNLPRQLLADLNQIVEAALRGREIVKKLLLFSRQTPPRKIRFNINSVIDEVIFLLEAGSLKQGIFFSKILRTDLPDVVGDPVQFRQVVVNLVVNAMQAINEKGEITLETKNTDASVELIVTDTGCGIPQKIINRIFDPFFTTKEVGEGTGLGLSVVHGIMTAHNGEIRVTTNPGHGTSFVVSLPLPDDNNGANRTNDNE